MGIVEIYADGACRGNPGPGGWGVLLRYRARAVQPNDHHRQEKELFGGESLTTNNRMELMAVIVGLEALKRPCEVFVYTDSQYVQKGMSEWIARWKKRGWLTSNRTLVKNADLWKRLESAAARYSITWQWIRGHAGFKDNERADQLANYGLKTCGNWLSTPKQPG